LTAADTYTFTGWATSASGTVITATQTFTANQTLYARHTVSGSNITITYNMNGSPGTKPADLQVASGSAIGSSAITAITGTNYTWKGWSLSPTASIRQTINTTTGATTIAVQEATYVTATATFTSNVTFYAHYESTAGTNITLTYDLNHFYMANRNNAIPSKTVASGRPIGSLALPNPTHPNMANFYTWLGWSTTKTGAVITGSQTFTANTTLYARYQITPPTYTHVPATSLS
jgi:hypothetical protein